MNKIDVTITEIASKEKVSLVSFSVGKERLEMISLGVSEDLSVGSAVSVGVKATSVALSQTKLSDVSISNQIETSIIAIEAGSLLCSIKLGFEGVVWESVITKSSMLAMQLSVGQKIVALIKSSDLSIVEVL